MKILMNKKTGIIVTTILIFLMSSSIFSLVNASSLLTDETVEIEEPKNTLKTGATSHLLNGMDINHGTADVGGDIFPSNFDYTLIPSDLNDVLSSYSAPSILTILFDESHSPSFYIGVEYSDFAGMLIAAGHTVGTIDSGPIDAAVLSGCDILVIACSMVAYTTAELDAIETWVTVGGSLLLITDWGSFGTYMDLLAARFGFDFRNDAIQDSDDDIGGGSSGQIYYDGPNILSHPITAGVSRVEMYAGDGLIAAPGDETPIIITDTDGTATWYYDATPAIGVSLVSVIDDGSAGAGKVCVIGDSNIWDSTDDSESDGTVNFYDSDNEILAWNIINWLAPAPSDSITILFDESHSPLQYVGGGYSEFAGMLTAAGHTVGTIDSGPIDATVLSECDILVIACSQDEYTTAELNAIETWVQYGGSLLLISDWGYIGTYVDLLAARFSFDFRNDAILDSDDDIGGGGSGQNYYDGPNILSHPITSGVSRVEMYAGDGLIAAPIDEIPIIITDTDGTATWYGDSTPAIGVSIMSAVDGGPAGLGKVVVIGDSNLWDGTSDAESDGVVNFYDSDNEILANNTINWLIPDLSDSITVLFDEAHSPSQYIGGGYSEFAGMITDLGYTVDTIDAGTVINATVLSECDILIIVCSQDAYTTAELDAIETWVQNGGNLLLITDYGGFGTDMDPLAARFGFDFMNDALLDSDDGVGTGDSSQLFYDGSNILSHPITAGVSRVEMYAGDGLIAAPGDETPIIITDTDGTATWYYNATPALGVSVMSVVDDGSAGDGKVVVIGDSNIWDNINDVDSDGDVGFYDSDNEILARNTIKWFISTISLTILFDETHSPNYYIGGGYSEFAGVLTTAGHTVDSIDTGPIDATVLSGCDILVIAASQSAYTTAELDAIETWVQDGGSLLLITDWGSYGTEMDPLAARFGFDFNNDCILDSDDSVGSSSQLFYDGPNILSHPITAGVSRVEMYAGDGLIAAPFDETPIIITDTDGTATWYYGGTPALGVSVMSVVDDGSAGAGKVVVIGDSNLWGSTYDTDGDGDLNFYDSDNDILAMNTINWLAPSIPDSLNVTSPDSSSSWETGTTHSITWTSEGSITNVKIELFKDGVFVLEITSNTTNDGDFSWTIPAGLDDSTQYQINISDVFNPDTYNLSEYFEIYTPNSITVTSPDSSSSWEAETTHSVTWTSTGSITNVKIELYKDGVFVLEIVASTGNDGDFSWTIPAGLDNSTQYQVNISDVSNPDTYDLSDNFEIFTIPEEDSLTVTNPSTATAWEMGSSHAITWTSTGSITTVKIELYKAGVFVLEIIASTANDGSYTWAIPTDLEDGIDYQIKISDVSNPATYDESPNFAITSIDIPEDGDGIIPSYNLYIIIGIISVVSVILVKNRKKIKSK